MAVFYQGDHARSEALLERAIRTDSAPMVARNGAALASVLAARGKRARAEKLIDTVLAGPYKDHHVYNSLGAAYAQLGQPDQALRWLRKAVDTGLPCHPWYARDPLLDPLRGDPKFKRFLEDVGKITEEARRRYAR
jgi:Tfp pilus assembly protein PilF